MQHQWGLLIRSHISLRTMLNAQTMTVILCLCLIQTSIRLGKSWRLLTPAPVEDKLRDEIAHLKKQVLFLEEIAGVERKEQ